MNKGKRQRFKIILYDERGKQRCSCNLVRKPYFINQAVKKHDKSNRWEIISTIKSRFNVRDFISWNFIEIVDEKGKIIKTAAVPKSPIRQPKVKVIYNQSESECDCGCSRCKDGMYCPNCSYHGQKEFERNWA